MARKPKRFKVTPKGFDDIGAVLTSMGEGFEFEEVSWTDLRNSESLEKCEVLFINCGPLTCDEEELSAAAPHIDRFIRSGGSVYASDWAGMFIQMAFPGVLEFDSRGQKGNFKCNIVDAGLQEILGLRIKIHFDMGSWWRVIRHNELTRVYVEDSAHRPVVVGFEHGKGHVIFTSFHNEAQVSKKEKELLEYLVLRPILANAAANAAQFAHAQQCEPGKEILSSIDRGQESPPYVYQAQGGEGVLFVLGWQDSGQLKMAVRNPAGQTVFEQTSGTSPLTFEATAAIGVWSCVITAASVPYDNFPYVLTLATRKRGITPPAQVAPSVPSTSQKLWPCYVLVDCSRWASDVAPQIGRGITSFLGALRARTTQGLSPAVSIVACRVGQKTVTPAKPLDQLSPMHLACSGELVLKDVLQGVAEAIDRHTAASDLKPLVIVVLLREAGDSPKAEASRVKQLAAEDKANIIAIGLGQEVQDATLQSIANITLRVSDIHGEGVKKCFNWIQQATEQILETLVGSGAKQAINLPPLPPEIKWLS